MLNLLLFTVLWFLHSVRYAVFSHLECSLHGCKSSVFPLLCSLHCVHHIVFTALCSLHCVNCVIVSCILTVRQWCEFLFSVNTGEHCVVLAACRTLCCVSSMQNTVLC